MTSGSPEQSARNSTPAESMLVRLADWKGREEPPSPWLSISQEMVNAFADLTGDHNFIHIDPERSAIESPYGATIAHGFLTLSLLSQMVSQIPKPEDSPYRDVTTMVNYGFDKLRFVSPVKVGSRVRVRRTLAEARPKGRNWVLLSHNVTVEIENNPKPAVVGEWLVLMVCRTDEA